jgi:molecular chaperone DnaK
MPRVIGIDLGTTYCAVAAVNPAGRAEILPNREGDNITPSVVMFDGDSPMVGAMAKQSAMANPTNVVQFVKRFMGIGDWTFISDSGQRYSAIEVSSLILRRLKEDAEMQLNDTIEGAVITVPAYFKDGQRQATVDAAELAGLKVLRIINEPTAAALAYGLERSSKEELIMVFDLGGGTFDITFMKVSAQAVEVISTGGDKDLGGFNFDNVLMAELNSRFQKETGIDLLDDPTTTQDLRDKAEMAKRALSSPNMNKTQVFLGAKGKTFRTTITLEEFEELSKQLFNKIKMIMKCVAEEASIKWGQVDKILLVGGSTRMKGIPILVEKICGRKPSIELHPDEVVAIGAALQAELVRKESSDNAVGIGGSIQSVKVSDVCSHSMGIVVATSFPGVNANSIVLKKDSKIPCEYSNVYATNHDNQTSLHVQVTEGEDEDLNYVTIAGDAIMAIPPYPAGSPVKVTFKYDANGIIKVFVYDVAGKRDLGMVEIKRAGAPSQQQLAESKQRMDVMKLS